MTMALVPAGESIWAEDEKLAGWVDLPLSDHGLTQAREAAGMLGAKSLKFSAAFTSMMKRGIHTLNIILDELDINWIKYKKHWRLNPQHLGTLQTETKSSVIQKYGQEQFDQWLGSYDSRPPAVEISDEKHPTMEIKYSGIPSAALPCSESLKDCEERLQSYWADKIAPVLLSGKNALVVSHRSTIKAFKKILGEVDEQSVYDAMIPAGIPKIYEFNQGLEIVESYYLADDEEVKSRLGGSLKY